ncbi:MAG: hypothetical protein GY844_29650 [Bradyrhizobium sp.]|uniref:hypothetical protein n=1 Tax=Sphingomonas sp. VL_57B TaxID=3144220 RepID=UPI0031F51F56|nr:hypothetical protein [Bradyrhizobium sp.]
MTTLILTHRHAAAYAALVAELDRRLALRRAGRPERQRAARKGVETKRRAG